MPRLPGWSSSAQALRESIFSRLQGRLAPGGVPLHLGDTWLRPPALTMRVDDPAVYRYGAPFGNAPLLTALSEKLRRDNQLTWAEPAALQITNGGTAALAVAARTVLDPDDEVLVPSPHWPLIRGIISNTGARAVDVPFSQALYAEPDRDPAELLLPHLTAKTAALYLTTPNNPDGKVLTRAQQARLCEFAAAHDLWVFSDEAYEHFAWTGEHHSFASLPGAAERTLTAFSFSKSYAMAGLRLGYLVGPPSVMAAARRIANHMVYNVPDLLQRAATTVLHAQVGPAWQTSARTAYREARQIASSLLPAPHHLPDGATYLFADLSAWVEPSEPSLWPLVEELLDAGVSVSPGEQFGAAWSRHARICFTAVPPARLAEGMRRIAAVLEKRRPTRRS